MNKKIWSNWLSENEECITKLNIGIQLLETHKIELNQNFKIDISSKPWYKNIVEIYIPQAIEFYKKCKDDKFNIDEYNDKWMRGSFKSFISEIEKFNKFIIKTIFDIVPNNFCGAINDLKKIIKDYKHLFVACVGTQNAWEEEINQIIVVLDNWRNVQNKNKHEHEHLDNSYYSNSKTAFIIDVDVLQYISDSIYQIINPLLLTLIII
ncbi:MAG: hypothetical protein RR201_02645 [Malacoplasma sp.]